jgi:hypothetical protein
MNLSTTVTSTARRMPGTATNRNPLCGKRTSRRRIDYTRR